MKYINPEDSSDLRRFGYNIFVQISGMVDSFRMDMSGDKSYREDTLETAMEIFNENTRSAAVVKACEHVRQDKRTKQRAVSYLARNVEPETTAQVIQHLSTSQLPIFNNIELNPKHDTPQITINFKNKP